MPVRLLLACDGCEAVTTTKPVRRDDDLPRLEPDGWVLWDPWTKCTYCPACMEAFLREAERVQRELEAPHGKEET